VSLQHHASVSLLPRKDFRSIWVCPREGLDAVAKKKIPQVMLLCVVTPCSDMAGDQRFRCLSYPHIHAKDGGSMGKR
jgi:hypothetical protein